LDAVNHETGQQDHHLTSLNFFFGDILKITYIVSLYKIVGKILIDKILEILALIALEIIYTELNKIYFGKQDVLK